MPFRRINIFVILTFLLNGQGISAELNGNFDDKKLDTKVWNDCQIDQPPLTFEELTGTDLQRHPQ